MCQAIVMNGQEGFRLVVIEDQQIVDWESLRTIQDLRRQVAATKKARCEAGWIAAAPLDRMSQRPRPKSTTTTAARLFPSP
ncbi:MAG: hypothetical protein ABIS06_02960 [Vicinamibacterales bacterium]